MKKITNRWISGLLAVLLVVAMLPVSALAAEANLEIGTLAQLQAFAAAVNGGTSYEGQTVVLTADISLGGETSPWTPIGTSSNPFKGTFDGGKHVVSDLYIASGSEKGLFGNVNGGTVKNVIVRGSVTGSSCVAGVVGKLTAGTVQNCGNEATVSGDSGVGGVVGAFSGASSAVGCYNSGAVSGATGYVGGVVGQGANSSTVQNCYNVGPVSGPATVGGVVGGHKAYRTAVSNCYNAGSVTGTANNYNYYGMVVGATKGTCAGNYYITSSTAGIMGAGANKVEVTVEPDGFTAVSTIEADKLGAAFVEDADNINNGYPILSWQVRVPDLIISTYEQLKAFADSVNGGNTYEGKLIRLDANIALGGEGMPWTPIGTSSNSFKGTFDGNYHVVSELYIASGTNVGFFGYVSGGTVKNLVVKGNVTGSSNTAGVAGYLKAGAVQNCGNEATVSGGSGVGGVVGAFNGASSAVGCYNSGAVSGTTGYIGGVVGQGANSSTVQNCYNVGSVSGSATVGGVVGGHKAYTTAVSNCYNAGVVTDSAGSSNNIGAVVGATRGAITNCYTLVDKGPANKTDVEVVTSVNAADLSDAFVAGATTPALAWESKVSTAAPVRPAFVEGTDLSAQLAAYIKTAIQSTKTQSGITGTLLGDTNYMAGASSTGTDWMALAMGRFGYFDQGDGNYYYLYDDGTGYADYLAAMKAYIEKTYAENNGILSSAKATEWHRAVVAIMALGGDPTDFGTFNGNPIDLIADGSYNNVNGPGKQGINGWIWGLIAMDTGYYAVPEDAEYTREDFIMEILKMQLTDGVNGNKYGGWVLGGYGSSSDVDITGMAIQALAPYYNDNTVYTYTNENSGEEVSKTVRQCVDEALDRLGSMFTEEAGFSSWNTENVEGIAQVIVALTSLGIDPAEDERFITKTGKTLLDGILRFQVSNGGFCHVLNGGWNSMATDQATYALVSYWRLENGMRALYDMRGDWTAAEKAAIEAAVAAIDALPAMTDASYKTALKSALEAFRAVPEAERRYVGNYADLAAAIDHVGGEDALDTEEPYIISISVTKNPDKLIYMEEESFDPAGMEVTAVYSDGTSKVITDYKLVPSGELSLGTDSITVSYGVVSCSVAITVREHMPWEGEGTEEDPYLIQDVEDLKALADRTNAGKSTADVYFVMTAHIDLSSIPNWTPIGRAEAYQFQGLFDGQGYVIDNLTSTSGGLFGYVGNDAVIKNVGVASGEIGTENTYSSFFGGIAKWSNGADFINCWNGAAIYCGGYSGGIVGTVRDGGESLIQGCYNVGTVIGSDGAVGGIVGHLGATGNSTTVAVTIKDCYNAGTITADDNAAGIVGRAQDGHVIQNCYNVGVVTVVGENILNGAGAIASLVTRDNEIIDCYYNSDLIDCGVSDGTDTTTGMTTEEMKSAEFLVLLGSSFKDDQYDLANGGYPLLSWQTTYDADDVNSVIEKIDAIGEVTLESEAVISGARDAYDALAQELQALVSNVAALEAAEEALVKLKKDQTDAAAAKAVADKIAAIGEVSLADETAINEAKAAYEALSKEQKALVTNLTKLEDAEKALAKLKKDQTDAAAAKAVADKIAAIGEVTLEDETAINAAKAAYEALTEEQKALVGNYQILQQAEAAIAQLKAENAQPSVTPDTGDNTPLMLLGVTAAVSMLGVLYLIKKKEIFI